jgi:hypothetical protein
MSIEQLNCDVAVKAKDDEIARLHAENRRLRAALSECAAISNRTLVREPGGWPLRQPTRDELYDAIMQVVKSV